MSTSFNLDQAIACWRAELNASGSIGSSDLAELETHLRDSFEELRTRGLSDDEAFHMARRRLGGAEVVEEFAKVNPDAVWAERARWMILGVLASQIFWSVIRSAGYLAEVLIAKSTSGFSWRGSALAWGLGLTSLISMGLFVCVLVLLIRGKWRLWNPKWTAFLLRPAVLAALVYVSIFVQLFSANLRLRYVEPGIYSQHIYIASWTGWGTALGTPLVLAAALIIAQRRARQVS